MIRMVPESYHHAEISKLLRQVEVLQGSVVDLRRKLLPRSRFPADWRLTPAQDRILAVLIDAAPEVVCHERVKIAASGLTSGTILDNTLTMHVALLRKKMVTIGFGSAVKTRHGFGYYISTKHAAQITAAAKPKARR